MNLKDIAVQWLKEHGYDGLFNDLGSCGCELCDLMPCEEPSGDCEPGFKVPCDPETCAADGNCDWHIAATREDE